MITLKDGTVLRNLEEQVLENKQQIAMHWNVDRVLADFGIHVRGTLPSKAALDQVPTADLEYGDAYFIGTAEPYDVWIWTRPDANAGEEEPYWLNIGHIAIEGPEGPQGPVGPAGPQGEEGTKWYVSSSEPAGARVGDMWFYSGSNASMVGSIFSYSITGSWVLVANIRGPQGLQGPQGPVGPRGEQGPQGIQGPRGDSGGFITVKGILTNENQLPTPASLSNLSAAYLVGTAAPYNLYIQVGESSASAVWVNSGPFNVGTLVSANGEYVNMWDADTKVDKATTARGIYGTNGIIYVQSIEPGSYSIARFSNEGRLKTNAPADNLDCVNKVYADANYVKVPAYGTGGLILRYSDGSTTYTETANYGTYKAYAVPRYTSTGTLVSNEPVNAIDVATKQYVDAQSIKPATPAAASAITIGTDGTIGALQYAASNVTNALVQRKANGCIACATGTQSNEATTKGYVDNLIRKPVTIYLNLGGSGGSVAAGVLGISAQLTPAEITALKAGITRDADDMTPRITALFNYMNNNRYTTDYLTLPINGHIMTADSSYFASGAVHSEGTSLKIRCGLTEQQQQQQELEYIDITNTNISRVTLIVHVPNDPDDESVQ